MLLHGAAAAGCAAPLKRHRLRWPGEFGGCAVKTNNSGGNSLRNQPILCIPNTLNGTYCYFYFSISQCQVTYESPSHPQDLLPDAAPDTLFHVRCWTFWSGSFARGAFAMRNSASVAAFLGSQQVPASTGPARSPGPCGLCGALQASTAPALGITGTWDLGSQGMRDRICASPTVRSRGAQTRRCRAKHQPGPARWPHPGPKHPSSRSVAAPPRAPAPHYACAS
jgi:hypothetical protein